MNTSIIYRGLLLRWLLLTVFVGLIELWTEVASALFGKGTHAVDPLVRAGASGVLLFFATGVAAEVTGKSADKLQFLIIRGIQISTAATMSEKLDVARRVVEHYLGAVTISLVLLTGVGFTSVVVYSKLLDRTLDPTPATIFSWLAVAASLYMSFRSTREDADELSQLLRP